MPDPVVSPADTPAPEFPDSTPRPWYFDGWDIFTSSSSAGPRGDGHRLVIPLKAINDTFHPSQRVSDDDARLIVAAVNERDALLAVGERDKAEIESLRDDATAYKSDLSVALDRMERDRQQIARLTAVVELVPRVGRLRWLAAVLDAMDERGWPEGLTYTFEDGVIVPLLQYPDLDTPDDAVQRDLRALADALEAAVLAGEEDARP